MSEIEISSLCNICKRPVCVSLYIRVKPWAGRDKRMRPAGNIPRNAHRFFGYWPPESHLVEYLKVEHAKGSLQRWYNENCRGHTLDEIVEAIEQTIPPLPGLPIRIMWNPATKVAGYMREENPAEKARLKMDIASQVRALNVYQKSDIRQAILILFNNTVQKAPALVSYPGAAIRSPDAPVAASSLSSREEANERIAARTKSNAAILAKYTRRRS